MEKYPDNCVKLFCEHILRKPIGGSTWRKWKTLLGLPNRVHSHPRKHAEWLAVLAYLKRVNPRGRHTLPDVSRTAQDKGVIEDIEWLTARVEIKNNLGIFYGSDLPEIIWANCGRKVTFPTLYYWGRLHPRLKFEKGRVYTKPEVEQWIEIAKENWQPESSRQKAASTTPP